MRTEINHKTHQNHQFMNQSILSKLEQLSMRLEEINALLSEQAIASDPNKFRDLSIEHSQLSPVNDQYQQYLSTQDDIETAQQMLGEDDADLKEMAEEEITSGKEKLQYSQRSSYKEKGLRYF